MNEIDREALKKMVEFSFPGARISLGDGEKPLIFVRGFRTELDKFPFSKIQDFLTGSFLFGYPYHLKEVSSIYFAARLGYVVLDFIFDDGEDHWLLDFFQSYYSGLIDFLKIYKKDISVVLGVNDFSLEEIMGFRFAVISLEKPESFWIYFKNRPSFEVVFSLIKHFTLFPRDGIVKVKENLSVLEKIFGG